MILTCPSCATSYFTPDDAIGPNGRRVRCQSCGDTWHAKPEATLELTAVAEDDALTDAARNGFGRRDDTAEAPPETLAETPAPELPRAYRARAEQQRQLRRAAVHGVVWAGLASVFVGVLAAAWLFRVEVVELYPRAAGAYAAVGAPVNVTGLDFEAMGIKVLANAPDKVLVTGAVRSIRDREIVAPPIRIALLDTHGAEIGHRIIKIDAAPVLPGGVQGFAAVIDDPGARIAGIGVDFTRIEAPAKTPARTSAKPAAAPADAATTTVRRPPAPDTAHDSGLRPALSTELNAPSGAQPVEAQPTHAPVH